MIRRIFRRIINLVVRFPILSVFLFLFLFSGFVMAKVEVMHVTSKPEFCADCHPALEPGPLGEYHSWANNVHAAAGVKCLDCHGEPGVVGYTIAKIGGMQDLYSEIFRSEEHKLDILTEIWLNHEAGTKIVPDSTCMHCHTDFVNYQNREGKLMSVGVKFREIDYVKNPEYREFYNLPDVTSDASMFASHQLHIDNGVSCSNCHQHVAHGGELFNMPYMETCFNCHDNAREEYIGEFAKSNIPANDDCETCHIKQVDIQAGEFLSEYSDVESVPWEMEFLACTDCHADAWTLPGDESCTDCHGDDYEGMIDVYQEDYEDFISEFREYWIVALPTRKDMRPAEREAFDEFDAYMRILEKDGSKGFHNPGYVYEVEEQLEELYRILTDM